MFAALGQAMSNLATAGIAVKNESNVPILVIISQLTPLYWQKVMPGETFNEHNKLGMGKVWFTCSCSAFDPKNEPTKEGVASSIAAIAVGTPLILPALAVGGAASVAGAGMLGLGALLTGTGWGLGIAAAGAVVGVGGTAAAVGGAAGAAAIIKQAKSIVGTKRDGVYSDGSTLFVRGRLDDAGVYTLFYADDSERLRAPYQGPPPPEAIAAYESIMRSGSVGANCVTDSGAGDGAGAVPSA
jgi:hypothetical protein